MGDDRVKNEAMEMISSFQVLPKLVVFDLDYTLWPFYWKARHVQLRQEKEAIDAMISSIKAEIPRLRITERCPLLLSDCLSKNSMPSLFPHAKDILYALKDRGVDIAIASRSPTPDIANDFLEKLGIKSMFVAQEIFSSWTHKTDHFQKIKQRTGVQYNEMLFFDDENRNIEAVSKMGVTSILVDDGVDLGALRQGLSKFSQNRSLLEKNKQRWRIFSQKSTSSEKDQ
ncbi:hypothetical protein DH2020_024012 [Rehmannia glutinosa]|uniref:Magnesium-dependent phosphatase n=1 Tax=Rehmannia glutinosa TaxID=99300 RepID=A0ABR0W9E8_REHGL